MSDRRTAMTAEESEANNASSGKYHWDYSMGIPDSNIIFTETIQSGGQWIDRPFSGTIQLTSDGLLLTKASSAYNINVLYNHPNYVITPPRYFEKSVQFSDFNYAIYDHLSLEEFNFFEVFGTKGSPWIPWAESQLTPTNVVSVADGNITVKSYIAGNTINATFYFNNILIKSYSPSKKSSYEPAYKNQIITGQYSPNKAFSMKVKSIDLIWR